MNTVVGSVGSLIGIYAAGIDLGWWEPNQVSATVLKYASLYAKFAICALPGFLLYAAIVLGRRRFRRNFVVVIAGYFTGSLAGAIICGWLGLSLAPPTTVIGGLRILAEQVGIAAVLGFLCRRYLNR